MRSAAPLSLLLVLLPATAAAQGDCWSTAPAPPGQDSVRVARAGGLRSLRATPVHGAAPTVDGRLNESLWCEAAAATDFVQTRPAPGALGTLPTSARVLFDQQAIYIGVRLFDGQPERITGRYPRRDDEVVSDWVFVELDTRFDRRSGFSFGLNPRGVQVDGSWWDDVTYDPAWNGVWQGAAAVDAKGWTAEFRIPFSQLALGRVTPGEPMTWGFNVYRTSPHLGETSNWSPRLPSVTGVISHFNHLEGILAPGGTRMEVLPYATVVGVKTPDRAADGVSQRLGGDLRLRPTPSSSAVLSLHPDFGQVEADPSQVNLTTFETFLPEQRPLFMEGTDIFQFPAGLSFASRGTSFADEAPFYSRRVGRTPRASLPAGLRAADIPLATTVLAAARLSARTPAGWSGGLFHAWTSGDHGTVLDSTGRHDEQLEPLTSYSVGRVVRASADGHAAAGLMLTAVNRLGLSARVDSQLTRNAYLVGSDVRWRRGAHDLSGFVLASRVAGSAPSIAALRSEARHGGVSGPADGRQVLTGASAQARFAKVDGALHWGVAARMVSRDFEANDAGFQRNADWLLLEGDWLYQRYRPGRWLRRWSVGSTGSGIGWTTGGLRRSSTANLSLGADLRSYWGGTLTLGQEWSALDPEILRGGPALRMPARQSLSARLYSDTRKAWQAALGVNGEREQTSGSWRVSLAPELSAFLTDRLQLGLTPAVGWAREGWQYVARSAPVGADPGAARYILGDLRQREVSLTTRATYAFSSRLTLQWYVQAFLSGGAYAGFSDVHSPRATRPSARVAAIRPGRLALDPERTYLLDGGSDSASTFADPAYSERSLHHSLVLRWEFLPGSALFVVWTHERGDERESPFVLGRDLRRLLEAPATNALQVKLSYWIAT